MNIIITTNDPLKRVPFNTQRFFVMGKTIDGCKIYMPVHIHKPKTKNIDLILKQSKDGLQSWLDDQYEKPDPFNYDDPFDDPPKTLA